MNHHRRVIHLFVASPGDLAEERRRLAAIVDGLNAQLAERLEVQLELKEWRQVTPTMGRPEEVILDQLPVESWDVFLGMLWLRFGMPPGRNRAGEDHDSGTEEEFRLAHRAWREKQRPRILFYRCTRAAPVSVDTKQLRKVQRFFDEFAPNGNTPGLFLDFGEAGQFERMVERHLTGLLIEEFRNSVISPKERKAAIPDSSQPRQGGKKRLAQTSPRIKSEPGAAIDGCQATAPWRNPFIVGVPVRDPADFFGRKREINFCLARIRGMQSVSIFGGRRYGKTSLLLYLTKTIQHELGPEYHAAYVDLLRPEARTMGGLLAEIQTQLGTRQPSFTLTGFAKAIERLHDHGIRPVAALDEWDVIRRLETTLRENLCDTLRALASNGRLVLLVASQVPLRELPDASNLVSPLHNILGTLKLDTLSEAEVERFVTQPRESVAFSEDQVAEILQLAKGHPLRLQVLCWHVAQANKNCRTDWAQVWIEANEEIESAFGGTASPVVTRPQESKGFDVFLSHNSRDKVEVRELVQALQSRGLKVWYDEFELVPGLPWQDILEDGIQNSSAAAVLVGRHGLGAWEFSEMRAYIAESVKQGIPVIPVLMPGVGEVPELPLFLKQHLWVDLRAGFTKEGLDRLEWGITGRKPL